jgi:hypothetical protein
MKSSHRVIGLAIIFMFVASAYALSIFNPVIGASQLSEQTALNRLERYQRPTPHNFTVDYSNTVMTVTYTGSESTADITVAGATITADAPGGTLDANFTSILLGDSATGCVRAIDACATINGYTGYTCSLFPGADAFLCIDFLAAAADTSTLTGAQLAATAAKNRAVSKVITAQGGHISLSLHGVLASSSSGVAKLHLSVYDGGSISNVIWDRLIDPRTGGAALNFYTMNYKFSSPGMVGSENEEMVIRMWTDGSTLSDGYVSAIATSHGY